MLICNFKRMLPCLWGSTFSFFYGKRFLVMLLFLLSIETLAAQSYRLIIEVVDAKTGKPLPFCHVLCKDLVSGNEYYSTTDLKGLSSVFVNDSCSIGISCVGYENLYDTITATSGRKVFNLIPGINLSEVVVTGQNDVIPADKSIYNIKLIGHEDIQQTASNNLATLLSYQPNIRITEDPSLGSKINLQGISGENVKILIDGIQVTGRLDGNIDLSQIVLNNVDHVEIVEGPMSVIYGSNALGGVINVITRVDKYARVKAGVDAYYESVGTFNINGSAYINNKRGSLGVNLGRNFFGGYSENNDEREQLWDPKEQYNAGIYYILNLDKIRTKLSVDYFRETLLDRNNPLPVYYILANETWYYTNRANANIDTKFEFSESNNLSLLLSCSWYSRNSEKFMKNLTNLDKINLNDNDTTMFNNYIVRGVYDLNIAERRLKLQAGLDLNLETAEGGRIVNGRESIGDYALFGSLQWLISENVIIQPSLRFAVNTKYNAPLVPSLNFKFSSGKHNLRVSYAHGFRAPSLKELYLDFNDSNHQIEGNPELKAESSHNINIAWSLAKLTNNIAELNASAYYNIIDNKITLVNIDPDNPIYYRNENIGEYQSIGGNISVTIIPLTSLEMRIGVSETGRCDDYYNSNSFIFNTNADASVQYRFWKNTTDVSVFYNYFSSYPEYVYNDEGEIVVNYLDSYSNMDITFTKRFFDQRIVVSTGVKNIFNNVIITGSTQGSGGVHGTGSAAVVGWGRTVFLGVKFNFSKYADD